jgi:hypothetical protein
MQFKQYFEESEKNKNVAKLLLEINLRFKPKRVGYGAPPDPNKALLDVKDSLYHTLDIRSFSPRGFSFFAKTSKDMNVEPFKDTLKTPDLKLFLLYTFKTRAVDSEIYTKVFESNLKSFMDDASKNDFHVLALVKDYKIDPIRGHMSDQSWDMFGGMIKAV